MLELAILGLLKERAMHGYQLKKHLAETLGSFWQVSYGSLYPALRRLQADGAVEMIFPKEQIGRRKNVYRITEKGEALFTDLGGADGRRGQRGQRVLCSPRVLQVPEARDPHPAARAAPGIPGGTRLQAQESLRAYKERIDNYTLSLMNHELAATETDIRWLDELIQAERRQVKAPPDGPPSPAAHPASPRRSAHR
jgi:DNA-binding PadR family transcriptional regulator